jgi:flagellar protein FlgJ
MTPQQFIAAIGPAARTSAASTKIPASFTVAEAALESGWGAHAPGMNLFGIKADAAWRGPVTMQTTHEVVNGQTITIQAEFRAYSDWLGSISDHAQFLLTNPRYQPAFAHQDGPGFATAVAAAGYATDPLYASKIVSIINAHGLAALDAAPALGGTIV